MATNAPNGGAPAPTASGGSSKPARPPITCHVLDTTVGMPARGIPVTLTLFVAVAPAPGSPAAAGPGATASVEFSGVTDADGRISSWRPGGTRTPPGTGAGGGEAADGVRAVLAAHEGDVSCALRFQARDYWAGRGVTRPFFPFVDVHFAVQGFKGGASPAAVTALAAQHWHVPLLLGPFNYTIYRGS